MSAQTSRFLAVSIATVSVVLAAMALTLAYAGRHVLPSWLTGWNVSDVSFDLDGVGVAVVGLVLASRRPANRIGWLLLAGALGVGLTAFSRQYAGHALFVASGAWPAGRAFAWFAKWIWVVPSAVLPFVFLIFPTGRLGSRRWLPVAWFTAGVSALIVAIEMLHASRFWSQPLSEPALAA